MHILFLSDNFPPEVNAAASRVFERAAYWVKWGHRVTVITCAPNFPVGKVYDGYQNKWYQKEMMAGIEVIRVKTYIAKNKGFLKRILDFVSYMLMATVVGSFQEKPDIIVANSPQFFTAVAGRFLGSIKRRPYVFEIADLWPESIRAVGAMKNEKIFSALEKLELYLYRKSLHVIAQTEAFKSNLVNRGIDSGKISVVMNGVDTKKYFPIERTSEICEKFNINNAETVIGYVGTHGMAQDLKTVLKAAQILPDKLKLQFVFVGEGAEKEKLQAYAERKSLCNLQFFPAVPKSEMPAVWSLFDIILIPLLNNKTFSTVVPSKLYEAMAMGQMIILLAPEGEASRLLIQHEAGVHINPGNSAQLAMVLQHLVENPDKMRSYREKARQTAMKYTREEQAEKMIRILETCLDAGVAHV